MTIVEANARAWEIIGRAARLWIHKHEHPFLHRAARYRTRLGR